MQDVESVSCEVSNGTVYIYNQYGHLVNTLYGFENAYSTGRSIIAETDSMSCTYSVGRDGTVKLTGSRSRLSRKPPSDNLIANFAMPERSQCEDSLGCDYTPSYSSGGSGGSSGCWFAFIIFAILYCLIYEKGCSHSEKEYHGKRGYICKYIHENMQYGRRLVALTKKGGDVAIVGDNGYAICGEYPIQLLDAIKKISNEGQRITDICLTDNGKWVVLYGGNGFWPNGLPEEMYNSLSKFHDDMEVLLSATINDKGDWVVISDKHFRSSSTEIQNWLKDGISKYGQLLSVSITDDAQAATFRHGWALRGNFPTGLSEALHKITYNPRIIRIAGDSWFFADETGWYSYNM